MRGVERAAQAAARHREATLGCPHGDAQGGGDLLMRVAEHIEEHAVGPVVGRQLGKRVAHAEVLHRSRALDSAGCGRAHCGRDPISALPAATFVVARVDQDAMQPRRRRRFVPKAALPLQGCYRLAR